MLCILKAKHLNLLNSFITNPFKPIYILKAYFICLFGVKFTFACGFSLENMRLFFAYSMKKHDSDVIKTENVETLEGFFMQIYSKPHTLN